MRLLSVKQVCEMVSVNDSTIWRWAKKGLFPRPIKVGPMTTRWKSDEVEKWLKHQSFEAGVPIERAEEGTSNER